jgi:hypothetical protein
MKSAFFLLLRLICYAALALLLAACLALLVVTVNGQCPKSMDFAATCATRFSERLANFSLTVLGPSLDTGVPIVLAFGGLVFLLRDLRRWRG